MSSNKQGANKEAVAAGEAKKLPTYTLADVKKHNRETDLWMAINGNVYDVTSFLDRHPGGPANLNDHAGEDATSEFMSIHSAGAKRQLEEFLIGHLPEGQGVRSSASSEGGSAFSYLVPVAVLAIAVWYQFLGGAEMLK